MDDTGPVGGQRAPQDVTGWTLVQAGHQMARHFREVLSRHGLTAHQFGILVRLDLEPGASQAELARTIMVTPQSVGPIIDRMEELGLVRRDGAPGRGRAIRVQVTAEGRGRLRDTYPAVGAINTPQALGLSADETSTLDALLHRVRDHLALS